MPTTTRDDRVEVDKVPICIALNLSAAVATRVVDATRLRVGEQELSLAKKF